MDPVVVSAFKLSEQPEHCAALSPLQKSVQTHTSGRYSKKAFFILSLTSLRMLVDILLPEHTPLMRLMQPLSSRLTFFSFLMVGMETCTSPPPSGKYPLLMILIESSLSNSQCSLRRGTRWCWMLSTELSWLSLVMPVSLTDREFLPNMASKIRYSRQQPMLRWSPQSKVNSMPSLLVMRPAQNFMCVAPLVTMILQPLEMLSIMERKRDSSALSPGGLRRMLMSSISRFCSATMAHSRVCLRLAGFFIVSIYC